MSNTSERDNMSLYAVRVAHILTIKCWNPHLANRVGVRDEAESSLLFCYTGMVCSHVVSCLSRNVCCASPLTPYYFLPDVLLGSLAGELKQKIEARTALVSVIGLGYVGLPLAVEKAKVGFKVLGVGQTPGGEGD
ncbi:hypothetical protein [Syntrophaceticus schinkii]|uniref:hypothetical protein n=1 Tax=Syntrophaceticus schinkii TaxID=499207 RepID=UPI001E64EF4D|nr:hypothetical protein [Syntrophaceticus schinkii]